MKRTQFIFLLFLNAFATLAQTDNTTVPAVAAYHNTWAGPLVSTPSRNKVDAPLMGNGDVTMCVGYLSLIHI